MKPKAIVEIAVEVTDAQLKHILSHLRMIRIPFYVEPPPPEPWRTLEDVELACEGK